MNFPLRIAFPESHRFWIVVPSFSFVSKYLLISSLISLSTYLLFNNMLFSFHVLACFSVFLWLICSFIVLCLEKMLDMISIFLNLLGLVLCCNKGYVLENVPCALEKNVYSAALEWNTLKVSVKSIWSSLSLKVAVSLLIFSLKDLSINVNGVLKSLTITITVSLSLSVRQDLL